MTTAWTPKAALELVASVKDRPRTEARALIKAAHFGAGPATAEALEAYESMVVNKTKAVREIPEGTCAVHDLIGDARIDYAKVDAQRTQRLFDETVASELFAAEIVETLRVAAGTDTDAKLTGAQAAEILRRLEDRTDRP